MVRKDVDSLTTLQALILGIVQGLTEFLPISSSGHLVLFQKLFGLKEGVVSFDIAVHVATLTAVFIIFRKDIFNMLRRPFGKLPMLLIVGTIPAVIIGVLFNDFIENAFETGSTLGLEFIFTGVILWYAESVKGKKKRLEQTTFTDAGIVGTAQGLAILPAVSRSGLTLAGALFRGLDREFALKFSFLLSIPAILGAAVLDLFDIIKSGSSLEAGIGITPLIAGMAAAAVSGYFAIKFMLKIFTRKSLKVFSYYVFALGIFVLFEQLFVGRLFGRLF